MAGMFSLLHKSQMRLDMNSSNMMSDDVTMDFRTAPNSSPLPGRRKPGVGPGYMNPWATSVDRLPKRFRKRSWYKRCHEIHPILRRSVCTLLLAAIGIVSGFTIFFIDYYNYQQVSTTGLVILCISFSICLVGIAWLCWSFSKLKRLKKKIKEAKAIRESRQEKVIKTNPYTWTMNGACDPAALSAAKWPVKRVSSCEKASWEGYARNYEAEKDDCSRTSSENFVASKGHHHTYASQEYLTTSSDEDNVFDGAPNREKALEAKYGSSPDPKVVHAERDPDPPVVPQIFVTNCLVGQHSHENEIARGAGNGVERSISRPVGIATN